MKKFPFCRSVSVLKRKPNKMKKGSNMRCKNKIIFAGISLIFLLLVILIGPADFFRHGFFCDVVEYNEIDEEDRLETVILAENDFQTTFSQ